MYLYMVVSYIYKIVNQTYINKYLNTVTVFKIIITFNNILLHIEN